MQRSNLAASLVEARNNGERKKLIAANPAIADARLARELKEYCYRVWTSEPAGAQKAAAALNVLLRFSPDKESRALCYWVQGVADITKGKLEAAVEDLDSATKLFRDLGHEHESAQPQVAKLIALAMLGRYDDARRTGEKALNIFTKYNDQLAAGKIEMNLSNLVSRRDQYRLAEHYCMSAYRRFRALGERSWQTMAENGLANTYAELNDFERAEKFYGRALERARASRMQVTVAEIEASIGNLALFRGRLSDAVRWLEASRLKYEKLGMPHQTAIAELEIADIYAELNLNSEAIDLYQKLIGRLHALKMRAEEARARANLGRTLVASEDLRRARVELRRASALYIAEKNPIAAAAVDLRRAALESKLEKYLNAIEIIDAVLPTIERSENVRLRLSAQWLRGNALAKSGRIDEARPALETVLKEARASEQIAIARVVMNSLGEIAYRRSDFRLAEKMFEEAIRSVEAARAPLPGEEFRMAFLAKTLAPYENLTRLHIENGEFEKALTCLERSRSRSLLESVTSRNPNTARTNAKIREELNWYYSRMDRADEADIPKLQREIRSREKRLTTALLRSQTTDEVSIVTAKTELDLGRLRRKLGPDKALVEFILDRGSYSVFVVTDAKIDFLPDIATEAEIMVLLEGLHFQFGALRFGAAAVGGFAAQLKARSDYYLEVLYRQLLRPPISITGERDIVVVPAGALNYVPFNALFDGARYAIESREIVISPSASVWLAMNARRGRSISKALLMSFADEKIPLVDREVAQLARTLPNSTKLTGRQATFAAFERHAPEYDLIHLACHGQFRPDNPMFSSLHLADGWVTVRDVCARRLKARLVTLSACETGLSKVFAGEEILGLARGFLSAGARSLVLSLWTVNDSATAGLMRDFYNSLQRGESVAASLRLAQLELIKQDSHPYFWSPFFVIG